MDGWGNFKFTENSGKLSRAWINSEVLRSYISLVFQRETKGPVPNNGPRSGKESIVADGHGMPEGNTLVDTFKFGKCTFFLEKGEKCPFPLQYNCLGANPTNLSGFEGSSGFDASSEVSKIDACEVQKTEGRVFENWSYTEKAHEYDEALLRYYHEDKMKGKAVTSHSAAKLAPTPPWVSDLSVLYEDEFEKYVYSAANMPSTSLLDVERYRYFSFPDMLRKFSSRGTKRIVIEKDPYLLDKALSFFFNSIGAVPRSLGIPQGVTVDSRFLEAASISLSPFGGSNFGYDAFYWTINKPNKYQIVHTKPGSYQPLKSNRVAASNFQPIVAEASSNTCWPAIRAAGVAITNGAKKFITHPVLIQVLMFGIITGVAGFSLGMWQGHPHDSSPPWLTAVLVTLPFIPIFCASILMPNVSIAFMIVPSVLGQVLGSMAVQSCLKSKPLPVTETSPTATKTSVGVSDPVGVEPPMPPPVVTSAVGASDRAGVNNDYKVPILGCNSFVADNGSSNNFNF